MVVSIRYQSRLQFKVAPGTLCTPIAVSRFNPLSIASSIQRWLIGGLITTLFMVSIRYQSRLQFKVLIALFVVSVLGWVSIRYQSRLQFKDRSKKANFVVLNVFQSAINRVFNSKQFGDLTNRVIGQTVSIRYQSRLQFKARLGEDDGRLRQWFQSAINRVFNSKASMMADIEERFRFQSAINRVFNSKLANCVANWRKSIVSIRYQSRLQFKALPTKARSRAETSRFNPLSIASSIQRANKWLPDEQGKRKFQSAINRVFNSKWESPLSFAGQVYVSIRYQSRLQFKAPD